MQIRRLGQLQFFAGNLTLAPQLSSPESRGFAGSVILSVTRKAKLKKSPHDCLAPGRVSECQQTRGQHCLPYHPSTLASQRKFLALVFALAIACAHLPSLAMPVKRETPARTVSLTKTSPLISS